MQTKTIAFAVLNALALSGCEDDRSAFEAFMECNDAIRAAESEDRALSCFTEDRAETIRSERFGDVEPWLDKFRKERPDTPRLFRAVEVEGATQLLLVDGDGPDYTRHIVHMTRVRGSWHIADWKMLLVGFRADPDMPAEISLSFEGAVDWTSEDIVMSPVSAPRCTIGLSHIFDAANVSFPVRCGLLTEPGEYDGETLLDPAADRGAYVTVEGSPNIGVDETRDIELNVLASPEGTISGEFRIAVSHEAGDYVAMGSFTNIPYRGQE